MILKQREASCASLLKVGWFHQRQIDVQTSEMKRMGVVEVMALIDVVLIDFLLAEIRKYLW